MPILTDSILINAPADALFRLSQDYALRRAWDPFVRDMQFLDGAREAAQGVGVRVRAWTGLTMEVRMTGFRPPTSVAMKMTRGPWFFHHFAGTWLFKPHASGATEVTFRYSFATSFPRLFDPVITWMFRRDIRARLHGLKRGAERDGLLERLGQTCG